MSIRIMVKVWDTKLPDSQKLILLALADWANDDGYCWPSIKQLADKCSKSERTIHNALQALREGGHLSSETIAGKGCRYIVHPVEKSDEKTPSDPCNGCTPATAAPLQRLHTTPATVAYNTSINPNIVNTDVFPIKRARAKTVFRLPDWVPETEWKAYVEMRKKIKKPLTDYAKQLAVAKLEKLEASGSPAAAVLEQSVFRSWQSLFPVNKKGEQKHDRSHKPDSAEPFAEIRDPMARVIAKRQAARAAGVNPDSGGDPDGWA